MGMLYLIWTEQHGFEPVIFTDELAAVYHCEKLDKFQAYRNCPPLIREIHSEALEDVTELA